MKIQTIVEDTKYGKQVVFTDLGTKESISSPHTFGERETAHQYAMFTLNLESNKDVKDINKIKWAAIS